MEVARPEDLALYGRLCAAALARAHARAGQPALLAGYLGSSTVFDESLAAFALAYADQNDRDYRVLSAGGPLRGVSKPSRGADRLGACSGTRPSRIGGVPGDGR